MSDSNRVALRIAEEATFATAPGTAYNALRYVTESLRQETTSVQSAEIKANRRISANQRTGISDAGDITFELSYGAYDSLFRRGIMSDADYSAEINDIAANTTIEVIAGPLIQDTGQDEAFANYSAGEWIEMRGFPTNAGNNGYFKITAITDESTSTFDNNQIAVLGGSTRLVIEANPGGGGVNMTQLGRIWDGTTFVTHTVEKEFQDLTNEFMLELGLGIDGIALNVVADQLVTGGFTFVGKNETPTAATDSSGDIAAPTNTVMNAVDNVIAMYKNGVAFDHTQWSKTLTNNLRARLQVASLGPISLGTGTTNDSGALQAYFTAQSQVDDYQSFGLFELAQIFEDGVGNGYIIDNPGTRFTSGQTVVSGQNADVLADMGLGTEEVSAQDRQISIVRFTSTSA